MPNNTTRVYLYEMLANRYQNMIERGVLNCGDKLPSVRALSKEEGISMSTTLQAYLLLERKGLVEARAKSGFYVRNQANNNKLIPKCIHPKPNRYFRQTDEIIRQVHRSLVDKNMISLSLNVPGLDLLPVAKLKTSALKVLRKNHENSLLYAPVSGIPSLKDEIVKICHHKGITTHPDEIIISSGTTEAISLAIQACTSPGDTIAIESPTFFGIFQAIEGLGRKPLEIATDPEKGIKLEQLEQRIKEHQIKACIVVTNFSNPLGASLSNDKKQALVNLMDQYQITLIENDVYGDMYFGKTRPTTCKRMDENENVIYCSSFSKTIAPGYRVGYLLSHKFYQKALDFKLSQLMSSPALPQEIIADFLKHGRFDLHMKNLRKQLFLQSLTYARDIHHYFPKSCRMTLPRGGFVFWIELPKAIDTTELFNELIEKRISIAPGQMFSKQANYKNYFRLSFGLPYTKEVKQAIQIIGNLLKQKLA